MGTDSKANHNRQTLGKQLQWRYDVTEPNRCQQDQKPPKTKNISKKFASSYEPQGSLEAVINPETSCTCNANFDISMGKHERDRIIMGFSNHHASSHTNRGRAGLTLQSAD